MLTEHRFFPNHQPGSAATPNSHAFSTAPGAKFHVTAEAAENPPAASQRPVLTAFPGAPPFTFWN